MLEKQLDFILKGGLTKRYHTNGTIREQSVAEHTFFVMCIFMIMYPTYRIADNLLMHDVAEGQTGDMASPVKKAVPALKGLLDAVEDAALKEAGFHLLEPNSDYVRMMKMADNMEGMLHCVEEIRRGNTDAIDIYNNFFQYILNLDPQGRELEMLVAIQGRLACQPQIRNK